MTAYNRVGASPVSNEGGRKLHPAGHLLIKVNDGNTRVMCEISSKLTIKTPERSISKCRLGSAIKVAENKFLSSFISFKKDNIFDDLHYFLHYSFLFLCIYLVPSLPPTNIRVISPDRETLLISWTVS